MEICSAWSPTSGAGGAAQIRTPLPPLFDRTVPKYIPETTTRVSPLTGPLSGDAPTTPAKPWYITFCLRAENCWPLSDTSTKDARWSVGLTTLKLTCTSSCKNGLSLASAPKPKVHSACGAQPVSKSASNKTTPSTAMRKPPAPSWYEISKAVCSRSESRCCECLRM
eukprot:scaffold86007_cov118-Phaeocystis_antarctica.AAC.2